jgi:predicted lipoprotein with Yx(FWY)xxD motif
MAFLKMRGRSGRRGWKAILLLTVSGLMIAAFVSFALAKTARTTLKTAHSSTLGKTIVVNPSSRTVYELRPETRHHLLCTSKACFQFWPPVKVRSAKAKLTKAAGIKGRLGVLHRDGFFQVTLGGLPLYRFSGDSRAGQTNGQGLMTFGGTWHVVTASSHKSSQGSTTTSPTTTMPIY